MEKDRERALWLDILRIVSAFCVIILHIAASGVIRKGSYMLSPGWHASNVWDGLVRVSVPLFVMISGSLFLDEGRDFDKRKMRKKEARLAVSYFFWSLLYSIWYMAVRFKGDPMSVEGVQRFIEKIILGGYGHLWFLPMLFGLYIIVPIFRKVTEDEETEKRFLILAFIFSSLHPALGLIPFIGDTASGFLSLFNMFLPLGYSGYFVLGHYLSKKEFSKKDKCAIYALGLIGLIVTVAGTALLTKAEGKPFLALYEYVMPNVAFSAASCFLSFRDLFASKSFSKRTEGVLEGLSSLTFGIYLVHIFVIKLLAAFGFDIYSLPEALSIPLLATAVSMISAASAYLIRKIPLLGRYVA